MLVGMSTGEIMGFHRGFVVQQAVRWVCFVFLLGALVSVLPSLNPDYSDTTTLLRDVQAGRTHTVFLGTSSYNSVDVVWSDGFAAWKRTTFDKPSSNGSQSGSQPS